jgi:hypothetical protein
MTTARQERKLRRAAVRLLATALTAAWSGAAASGPVVSNRHTGLAIDGFDPVAYFVAGAPKLGRAELELRAKGAIWRFANEGNRSAFDAAPEVYMPRFGGHDPLAVARGAATAGNPALWLVARQRLYLFYSAAARAAFVADPDRAIEAAERRWPALRRTLAP